MRFVLESTFGDDKVAADTRNFSIVSPTARAAVRDSVGFGNSAQVCDW